MAKVIARRQHGQSHGPVAIADQRHIAEGGAGAENDQVEGAFVAFGQKDFADCRNECDGHVDVSDVGRLFEVKAELGGDQSDGADAGEQLRVTVEGFDGFLVVVIVEEIYFFA